MAGLTYSVTWDMSVESELPSHCPLSNCLARLYHDWFCLAIFLAYVSRIALMAKYGSRYPPMISQLIGELQYKTGRGACVITNDTGGQNI